MTDLKVNCEICEDTLKVSERVWNGHGFASEEVDCECVHEAIARRKERDEESQLDAHLEENGSEPIN